MTALLTTPSGAVSAAPVIERIRRSVVAVEDGTRGAGAGVVWPGERLVITNDHVARGERVSVIFEDGRRLDGRVIAKDAAVDLAAIRVERDGLQPVELGDARAVRAGQLVFAIGHPLGLANAVTVGIVNRAPDAAERRELLSANINLNRGNSGGPLVDARGRVLGINAMVATPGIGLAIPSHVVQEFIAGHVGPRPFIGAELLALEHEAGLIVTGVLPESPAEAAGLFPGDVIRGAAGRPITRPEEFLSALVDTGIGEELALVVDRAGSAVEITCKVVARA